MAVNIEVIIPMQRVTEKPLIGPVPKEYRMIATKKVVKLASKIVKKALSYPWSIACKGLTPCFSSSLIRENINTFASIAIPTVRTMPAIPGKVNVADKMDIIATKITILAAKAKLAATPKTL